MKTPPFTLVLYRKRQNLDDRPGHKRVSMYLRRLHRANEILSCSDRRFKVRWSQNLSPSELQSALEHRHDFDLWLDAMMIIYEKTQYYQSLS